MAIYALGITPITMMMIELVTTQSDNRKIVGFADGFSATEKFKLLLQWWTALLEVDQSLFFSLSQQNCGSSHTLKHMALEKSFQKY